MQRRKSDTQFTRNSMTKRRQHQSMHHMTFFSFFFAIWSTTCIFRMVLKMFHLIHLSWTYFIYSATHLNILLRLVIQLCSCLHPLFFLVVFFHSGKKGIRIHHWPPSSFHYTFSSASRCLLLVACWCGLTRIVYSLQHINTEVYGCLSVPAVGGKTSPECHNDGFPLRGILSLLLPPNHPHPPPCPNHSF